MAAILLGNGVGGRITTAPHYICVSIFSINLSETFLIPRRIRRGIIINLHWSSLKVPVTRVRLMKPEFSQQIFEKKYSNIKFYENPSIERGIVPCGQRSRHMTKLIVAFRSFADKSWNAWIQLEYLDISRAAEGPTLKANTVVIVVVLIAVLNISRDFLCNGANRTSVWLTDLETYIFKYPPFGYCTLTHK